MLAGLADCKAQLRSHGVRVHDCAHAFADAVCAYPGPLHGFSTYRVAQPSDAKRERSAHYTDWLHLHVLPDLLLAHPAGIIHCHVRLSKRLHKTAFADQGHPTAAVTVRWLYVYFWSAGGPTRMQPGAWIA